MPSFKRDTILGLVFFGGLLVLLWATARLSNFSLAPKQRLQVYFPNSRGLSIGDRVYVLGTPYGIVSDVQYEPANAENQIKITLQLGHPLTLRKGYRIRIAANSLLGGSKVTIDPGPVKNPILGPADRPLVGEAPVSALEGIGEWFSKGETQESLSTILEGLASIVREVKEGRGTFGRLVKDPALYEQALGTITDLRRTITDAREGKGSLGRFLTDPGLYDEARGFFASARKVADSLESGEGIGPFLLHDRRAREELAGTIHDVKTITGDLVEGRGMVGKALRDPGTAERFDSIVANVDEASRALNEGEGLLPALLHGRGIRDDATAMLANFRKFSESLAGSTALSDLERVLRQISGAVEDAREAAPISTFFTIFGGTFQ